MTAFNDYAAAGEALSQDWRITGKLDHVTKALFAVYKDDLISQVLAFPLRAL
jgi:hypothetical protein